MEWLLCPICKSKTRLQLREDTELKNFPLYCPKCKQKTLINVKDLQITVFKSKNTNQTMYAAAMDKTVTAVFQCLPAISVNGFLTLSLRRLLLVAFLYLTQMF